SVTTAGAGPALATDSRPGPAPARTSSSVITPPVSPRVCRTHSASDPSSARATVTHGTTGSHGGSMNTSTNRVAVVGAGMVGLSTAWFLQERGVEVTVYDRSGVAAGSSWGNAGWLTPGISTPLPEPAVLKYGIRAALSPASPVYVPPSLDRRLLRFLAR